jgi:hypothetical protein
LIYVGLGDQDQAMIWLNTAFEARFKASILLHPVLIRCGPTLGSGISRAVSAFPEQSGSGLRSSLIGFAMAAKASSVTRPPRASGGGSGFLGLILHRCSI